MFAATALVFASSCTDKPKQTEKETTETVEVYNPSRSEGMNIVTSGRITAENNAVIATRVMGFVDKIYVKEGDKVAKGQLLITINSSDIAAQRAKAQAALNSAQAAYQMAERDYNRYNNLYQQGSASAKELERMQVGKTTAASQVEMARQSLREIATMLSYTRICAPFSGTVTQKMIDEGSTANPGMPLMAIEQSGRLNVSALIPESVIGNVNEGDAVKVTVKSAGTEFTGQITQLSPSATMTGGQYSAKISISPDVAARLKSGMYAGVVINNDRKRESGSVMTVEKSSIVKEGQLQGVYVVSPQNRIVLRWLRLGNDYGTHVEVISGISAKDKVVRNPAKSIKTGEKVNIK